MTANTHSNNTFHSFQFESIFIAVQHLFQVFMSEIIIYLINFPIINLKKKSKSE